MDQTDDFEGLPPSGFVISKQDRDDLRYLLAQVPTPLAHRLERVLDHAKVVCNYPFHQHSDNNPPREECLNE